MAVDARTEEFQHIEVFDKFALFTNARIDRTTVPEGWYCYDFRGTGDDPGELRFIEESVVVNHSGSILMPEKLELPASGQLDAWDEFGFLDECDMTLREFCEVHDLPYPAEEEEFHIRPARPDEAGLFVYRKPLAGRVVQKRLLPMRKNKTPSVIVEMRSGNCKLQNKGRPFKNEAAETV